MRNGKVTISEVADINPRFTADKRPENKELVTFVPMASVSEETLSIEKPIDRQYSEVAKGFTPFCRGDILIAKITPCFENGKMAFTQNLPRRLGFGSTEFHVLRPKQNLDGAYLFHLLRAPFVRKAGEMKMKGAAGQRRVPADFFAQLQIPLPPLAEQKRIAAILDAADNLRGKRRETIAQLDSLLQSTFLDMFGDPVTNPKGWEKILLGSKAKRITKGQSPNWQGFNYQKDGVLFVTSENVREGHLDISTPKFIPPEFHAKLRGSQLQSGDLLINLVGASIGRSCIFKDFIGAANVNQAVGVVTLNEPILANYILQLLQTKQGQSFLTGRIVEAARANISLTDLRQMSLPLPPLSLQQKFATIVESVEQQKTRMRAHLAELDALFASLQSRAFNGEL
jgi:type I restriction enzyme S subunit